MIQGCVRLLFTLFLLMVSVPAHASYYPDPNVKWRAHVDLNMKAGQDRNIGRFDFMIPILQDDRTLLFADVRAMGDSRDAREGNFGVGVRRIFNNRFILGAYGFYDRKLTKSSKFFNQGVLGAEFLTEDFDIRGNYYFNNGKVNYNVVGVTGFTVQLQGNNVTLTQGQQFFEERILGGCDVHVGFRNVLLPWEYEGRFNIGYFNFHEKYYPHVEGLRFSYEQKIRDWLFVEFESQEDRVRGNTNYGGIRLRYELNKPRHKKSLTRLEQRMTSKIYRDIDAIDQRRSTGEAPVSEDCPIFDAFGNPIPTLASIKQSILHYDDTKVGSANLGTFEDPCTDEACVSNNLSTLGEGTILYVHPGATLTLTSQLALSDYQRVVGSGSPLFVKKDQGTIILLQQGGASSNLTVGAGVTVSGIELANDNQVAGMNITNPRSVATIRANNVNNSYIHNNTINHVGGGNAILLTGSGTNASSGHRIENNTITGSSSSEGIHIDHSNTSSMGVTSITGNTISGSLSSIYIDPATSTTTNITSISNNTLTAGAIIGIEVTSSNVTINTISNNTLSNFTSNASMFLNGVIIENISNNIIENNRRGIQHQFGPIQNITNNTIRNNQLVGITSRNIIRNINGNTITNNGGLGIELTSGGQDGVLNIMNNTIDGHTTRGIRVVNTVDFGTIDFGNGVSFNGPNVSVPNQNDMGSNTGTNLATNLGQ